MTLDFRALAAIAEDDLVHCGDPSQVPQMGLRHVDLDVCRMAMMFEGGGKDIDGGKEQIAGHPIAQAAFASGGRSKSAVRRRTVPKIFWFPLTP